MKPQHRLYDVLGLEGQSFFSYSSPRTIWYRGKRYRRYQDNMMCLCSAKKVWRLAHKQKLIPKIFIYSNWPTIYGVYTHLYFPNESEYWQR